MQQNYESGGKDRNTNSTLCLYIMTPYLKAGTNNFGTHQMYRSYSCVWGDDWEPPWIPWGDVTWLPGGADNISFLNYTQYRTQLNFATPKGIFWTNGSYFSASSPNTRKYLLAHNYPYKIPYSPQPWPDTCDSIILQCHNQKDHNTGWYKTRHPCKLEDVGHHQLSICWTAKYFIIHKIF